MESDPALSKGRRECVIFAPVCYFRAIGAPFSLGSAPIVLLDAPGRGRDAGWLRMRSRIRGRNAAFPRHGDRLGHHGHARLRRTHSRMPRRSNPRSSKPITTIPSSMRSAPVCARRTKASRRHKRLPAEDDGLGRDRRRGLQLPPAEPRFRPGGGSPLRTIIQDQRILPRGAGAQLKQTIFDSGATSNSVRQAESQVLAARETLRNIEEAVLFSGAQRLHERAARHGDPESAEKQCRRAPGAACARRGTASTWARSRARTWRRRNRGSRARIPR